MTYLLLIVGFLLLIFGANYFVGSASNIAGFLRISPLLIGLTIVAFGTSSPEATVSILAAIEGSADVAVGNVIGSNIFNITFVVGLTAIVYPLKVENTTIRKEIPFTLMASLALFIFISDISLDSSAANAVSRSDGMMLLLLFAVFLYYLFEVARKSRNETRNETLTVPSPSRWAKEIVVTVLSLTAIILGGNLVVNSSTDIALSLGMSETLVGLTIVAVGTSLPELVTSMAAAIKKESEIALGNIVGSNIFNILFVLGTSAAIAPLPINPKIFIDIAIMILLTILLLIFSRSNYRVGKFEGTALASAYVIYIIYIIIRN